MSARPWQRTGRLIALDVDGTVLRHDGSISSRVRIAVHRAADRGNEVMLATGRSVAATLPVLELLDLVPEHVVCCNGAVTLQRDGRSRTGYVRSSVETFDPSAVLTTIHDALPAARYAVEDAEGGYRYTAEFPMGAMGERSQQVTFDQLLRTQATRVVVVSPDHELEEFLGLVDRMGLHRVNYSVGWTSWLDIAPDGVNKGTAMEAVRQSLDVPRERVVAVGDGRNDIEMLEWASAHGLGVAMGQAPEEVRLAASQVAPSVADDGLATFLDSLS